MISLCQSGYESLLARELEMGGLVVQAQGPGWALSAASAPGAAPSSPDSGGLPDLAFAQLSLRDPMQLKGESVNALAQGIADYLLQSLRGERVDAPWPCVFDGPADLVGLGRRVGAVEKTFHDELRKRLSRVEKLASADRPRSMGIARGLFVWFVDFGHCFMAREAQVHGQRRMADDPLAPSRSYLKIEEAYSVLGREPQEGETVVDLGAAPGGWSYSAAKRGARVLAIDNGPLKGGALGHPNIEHRTEDAFKFQPREGESFDWLFCDIVEEPHHVIRNIIEPWLARGWCRHYVINLKFGRVDHNAFLQELRAPSSPFVAHSSCWHVRHLYHDREEFTVVGEVRPRK
ncbi:MAG: SAM-dependent methyltransferase [Opitutaceae bacterium]